ncbi:hypothetical protein ASG60_06320 [Methylobacterium sp. Leaf469]|nr:hypothetical protein ASG60_06320 [Methylobacterium sp. Leaf469]
MAAMIRTDNELIAELEAVMQRLRELELITSNMERFFEVGEWLLCFEGAWMLARDDPDHPLQSDKSYLALVAYFAGEIA